MAEFDRTGMKNLAEAMIANAEAEAGKGNAEAAEWLASTRATVYFDFANINQEWFLKLLKEKYRKEAA